MGRRERGPSRSRDERLRDFGVYVSLKGGRSVCCLDEDTMSPRGLPSITVSYTCLHSIKWQACRVWVCAVSLPRYGDCQGHCPWTAGAIEGCFTTSVIGRPNFLDLQFLQERLGRRERIKHLGRWIWMLAKPDA